MADEPVSRILSGAPFAKRKTRRGDHSSRSRFAPRLEQPTRGFSFAAAFAATNEAHLLQEGVLNEPGRLSPPIWPCTTRGFPCLVCRQTSGGLLPHRFTLACGISFETSCRFPCSMPPCSISPAVYFLWHFP